MRKHIWPILVVVFLAAAFVTAESNVTPCEQCGARMEPFAAGTSRQDDDILECPQCHYMLNRRHWAN